jgi:Tol biopolymer transport system component
MTETQGMSGPRREIRRLRLVAALSACGVLLGAVGPGAFSAEARTVRVSVSSAGAQADLPSFDPSISASGRFVAFSSVATNLVHGDTNHVRDVFVRDRKAGKTRRVSLSSAGAQGHGDSFHPSISANGRFVAFQSLARNLVRGDTNHCRDIFVRDRRTGKTRRVSLSSAGAQGNDGSRNPSISADARIVAFESEAKNLVRGDTNHASDIFVRDRETGKTRRVSLGLAGAQANGRSFNPSISANGRFVAFESGAKNLVRGDTNHRIDIFVRDRKKGKTTRVSVSSTGAQGNNTSFAPSISSFGRFVAFESSATNLVRTDTNRASDVFVRDRKTGETTRVSVSSTGAQAQEDSFDPSISADGRFVAFTSIAMNLVPGRTSDRGDVFVNDVFVRDRQAGKTRRVSVSSTGAPGNSDSFRPSISADGRIVAFQSWATNLVRHDTNDATDIFIGSD